MAGLNSPWARTAAVVAAVLVLLVVGAALRPVIFGDTASGARVHPMSDNATGRAATGLGPTEIAFAQDMAVHHQQALTMVQLLDPQASPEVAGLARQIGDSQRIEIGMLLGWLRLSGATVTNPAPMAWMRDGGHGGDGGDGHGDPAAPGLMPGMANSAELDALAAARGPDSEVLFLQLMHRHHVAGVQMAQAADQRLEAGTVKQAAREMIQEQSRETGVLTLLLDQRGVPPLPLNPS
nr:DUF305 domain-containing protein [Tomitella biformata]